MRKHSLEMRIGKRIVIFLFLFIAASLALFILHEIFTTCPAICINGESSDFWKDSLIRTVAFYAALIPGFLLVIHNNWLSSLSKFTLVSAIIILLAYASILPMIFQSAGY